MWNLRHKLSVWVFGVHAPADLVSNTRQAVTIASSTQIKCLLALLIVLISAPGLGVGPAFAQTDFGIKSQNPDLRAQYQRELDKWMLQAYEGNHDAQFKVGVLFTNEQFNKPDYEQSAYWYQQAAKNGHVLAQFNLGHQYLIGQGVPRDEKIAMSWWLKAAQQDHALASFNIGRAYYLGIGLDKDHGLARYWFERAAQNREPKSIEILEKLGWAKKGEYQITAKAPTPPTPSQANALAQASADADKVIAENVKANEQQDERFGQDTFTVSDLAAADPLPKASASDASLQQQTDQQQARPITANTSETEVSDQVTTQTVASVQVPAPVEVSHPLAIYTDPAKRSVLITIIDQRDGLSVEEQGDEWVVVTLESGLPVWVHQNFIRVAGSKGAIAGSNVNARAVPIIASGTVVGQLERNQAVEVIDQQNEWFRVQSPSSFRGWAKRSDYDSKSISKEQDVIAQRPAAEQAIAPQPSVETTETQVQTPEPQVESPEPSAAPAASTAAISGDETDVNEWLFSQDEENLTMQLASFDDPAKTAQFAANKRFKDNPEVRRLTSIRNGTEWTYFLYGNYGSREEAESAKNEIKQKRAWIRSFGRLQENRCLSWKQQIPAPAELNKYCVQ